MSPIHREVAWSGLRSSARRLRLMRDLMPCGLLGMMGALALVGLLLHGLLHDDRRRHAGAIWC